MIRKIFPYAIAAILFLLLVVCVNLYNNNPQILKMVEVVTAEYNGIHQLPQAELVDFQKTHKFNNVFVYGSYISDLDYNEVKNYYVKELGTLGWSYKGENVTNDINKDQDITTIVFVKEKYQLNIEFDNKYDNGWNYIISIDWYN